MFRSLTLGVENENWYGRSSLLPATDVFMPTERLLLLVAPGASRLKLPEAVMPPLPEIDALSAAC